MIDDVQMAEQPFDRLTRLCDVMTTALEEAIEVEAEEARGNEDANLSPVRSIVFLSDDHKSGIVTHGYDDAASAMAELFVHIKATFQAMGKDLDFIAIPDSPEGMNT